jgi:hypothetical protein
VIGMKSLNLSKFLFKKKRIKLENNKPVEGLRIGKIKKTLKTRNMGY